MGEDLDPRMVIRLLEAAEGGAEAQIPNDIESCPVEPLAHVQSGKAGIALLLKPPDQQVDVRTNDWLLGLHGALGESVGKLAAQHGVFVSGGVDDTSRHVVNDAVQTIVLGQLRCSVVTMTIDVFPCLRVAKGQLIRGDPYNGAVFGVKVSHSEDKFSLRQVDRFRELAGTPQERSRERPQWVQENIVKSDAYKVDNYLCGRLDDCFFSFSSYNLECFTSAKRGVLTSEQPTKARSSGLPCCRGAMITHICAMRSVNGSAKVLMPVRGSTMIERGLSLY